MKHIHYRYHALGHARLVTRSPRRLSPSDFHIVAPANLGLIIVFTYGGNKTTFIRFVLYMNIQEAVI